MNESTEDIPTLRISVVMTTYNGGRYLREQLDTIFHQTYPLWEVVVQDDGSTDETMAILEEYAQRYTAMKVFVNEGQHGVNGNFFSAMRRATGDFIATSDQDDLWELNKLELQAKAIGEAMMCTGFSVPFSAEGFPVKVDSRRPNLHLIRNTYLSQIPGHTMLFRRELLGYLPEGEKVRFYYDWQLACVATAMESVVFVDKKLVNFRRHPDANTAMMPVGHQLMSGSAGKYVWTSVRHHCALQRAVRERFTDVLPFLESLPFQTRSLQESVKMSRLQVRRGPLAFMGRVWFFLRHQHHIFHTEEHRPLVRWARAAFFVFSCGYYYRNKIK